MRHSGGVLSDENKSVLHEVREFLRQRDDYKARLLEDLETAKAVVVEIEAALVELGATPEKERSGTAHGVTKKSSQTRQGELPGIGKGTLPDLAVSIVAKNPGGLGPGEIIEAIQALSPKSSRGAIYPALYRARDQGRLRVHGKKYFLPKIKEAAE